MWAKMLSIIFQVLFTQICLKILDVLHRYAVEKCDFYNFDFDLADHIRYLSRMYNIKTGEHKATETAL